MAENKTDNSSKIAMAESIKTKQPIPYGGWLYGVFALVIISCCMSLLLLLKSFGSSEAVGLFINLLIIIQFVVALMSVAAFLLKKHSFINIFGIYLVWLTITRLYFIYQIVSDPFVFYDLSYLIIMSIAVGMLAVYVICLIYLVCSKRVKETFVL